MFEKKVYILKEEVQTFNCYIFIYFTHHEVTGVYILADCQEMLIIHFSQFLRKIFSKSGAFLFEILC